MDHIQFSKLLAKQHYKTSLMNFKDFLNNENSFKNDANLFTKDHNKKAPLHFLASGYAIEYIMVDGVKKVIRFIDPQQFILRFSTGHYVKVLAGSYTVNLEWDKLVEMLRQFPETAQLHKAIKERHFEQIRQHHDGLKKTAAERYFSLLEKQPWVKQTADPTDIASYLNLSITQYTKLTLVE